MSLRQVRLLLLGAALGAFLPEGCSGSFRHSLCYSYLHLPEMPLFLAMIHLDDQPIAHYDSQTSKMVPLVSWMKTEEMKPFLSPGWVFRADLESMQHLQNEGLHTWQAILGCELGEDGSQGGFLHYGYDGMDFISFNKETLSWVAAQPQAQKVKEEWEEDPGWSQRKKIFLEETCTEQLQRYLSYGRKALKRTEAPVVKVTHQTVSDNVETLICQAYGFYPKEIQATWIRNGKISKDKALRRNVVPNFDGTYYVWISIEIDPKERDHYSCLVEHDGLQETDEELEDQGLLKWILQGSLVFSNVYLMFLLLICKRRRKLQALEAFNVGFIFCADIAVCISPIGVIYQAISGGMAAVLFLLFHWYVCL